MFLLLSASPFLQQTSTASSPTTRSMFSCLSVFFKATLFFLQCCSYRALSPGQQKTLAVQQNWTKKLLRAQRGLERPRSYCCNLKKKIKKKMDNYRVKLFMQVLVPVSLK